MLAVAVGAARGVGLTTLDQLTVDTVPEFLFYGLVTLTASFRDVEVVDGGIRVSGGIDLMRGSLSGMAVIAAGRHINTIFVGLAMDTAFIYFNGMVDQYLILGGEVQVLVAFPAGQRKVDRMGF